MAYHSFNTTLAKRYGVDEAIIIEHLYFWIHKNECNDEMIKDDRVWCYSSMKGFERYVDYMNSQRIRRITLKLKKLGLILIGNFNKVGTNQTLWYSFTEKMIKELEDLDYHFLKMKNGVFKTEKCEDTNNEYNKNKDFPKEKSKKDESCADIIKELIPDFADLWKKYHQGSKQAALKRWNNMSTIDQALAIDMIDDYLIYCKRSKRPKKDVATFLNQKCYKDDYKNIIPDYYQEQPADNERMIKFKRYMVSRFADLIFHRNPLTFEQASELLDKWGTDQFEWAMDKLAKRDIHQYYSISQGVLDILENDEI